MCRAKGVETCRCKAMDRRKQEFRELPKDTPAPTLKLGEWADMIGNGVDDNTGCEKEKF